MGLCWLLVMRSPISQYLKDDQKRRMGQWMWEEILRTGERAWKGIDEESLEPDWRAAVEQRACERGRGGHRALRGIRAVRGITVMRGSQGDEGASGW